MSSPNQHQHLYGKQRWRNTARQQLRLQPLCAFCLKRGVVQAAQVADHVEPHHGDPHKFWFGELQSLCKPCHDSGKKYQQMLGYDRDAGDDGLPLDPNHPFNQAGGEVQKKNPPG